MSMNLSLYVCIILFIYLFIHVFILNSLWSWVLCLIYFHVVCLPINVTHSQYVKLDHHIR